MAALHTLDPHVRAALRENDDTPQITAALGFIAGVVVTIIVGAGVFATLTLLA